MLPSSSPIPLATANPLEADATQWYKLESGSLPAPKKLLPLLLYKVLKPINQLPTLA
jgi:hypothetical protein